MGPIPVPLPETLADWKAEEIAALAAELAKRRAESLVLYEPLPRQQAFHEDKSPERLLRGSNRGGKTLPAAVEVARAVMNRDPYYKWPDKAGRIYCVGKDFTHIGEVMWRKLGRAGAFKIIRDLHTNQWRAFRPWDLEDFKRRKLAKEAPPLIPHRMIKEIAWEEKKKSIPSLVKMHNGWELHFFSSQGEPPNGADVDGVWFDEEIEHQGWYPEMAARLLDRSGLFMWSATPQAGTEQLYELHEKAEAASLESGPALVREHVILLEQNPHITDIQKAQLRAKLSEEEIRVRVEGEFAITSFRVFPEYHKLTHGVSWFEVPKPWTRYAIIDPGRQVCAVLFIAVPPPDEADARYLYDELYIRNCNAEMFGKKMAEKCMGDQFQAFIIDHQGSRVTETASGITIEYQYAQALRKNKVSSVETGHGFRWGDENVTAGVEAMRSWLINRSDGDHPRLRVIFERMPNFDWEINHYRYKKTPGKLGSITDKPEDRGRVHLMACLRYAAMHGCRYVAPRKQKTAITGALRALMLKRARARDRNNDGGGYVRLGPGSSGR